MMAYKIFIITIITFSTKVNATIYYVSNGGNDTNNGRCECKSWRTLYKINNFNFSDNDSILFKAGDIWNEKLIVPHSNLYFGKYGSCDNPLITGFQIQDGFIQHGNIWETIAVNAVKNLNTVLLNDKLSFKARYPNSGFLAVKGPLRPDYITPVIPNTDNYIGSEIVVRTQNWVIDLRKVTTQTSTTLTLDKRLAYNISNEGGYFFQNQSRFIDSVGEFSFDSATKKLNVYSISTPSVQISSIDTLVLVNHKDNVTFENISFAGANMYTVKVDTSQNFTIKNFSINYAGNFGIYASKSKNIVVDNGRIENCYNVGLLLGNQHAGKFGIITDTCRKAKVTNNAIKNIGAIAGMASVGLYPGDGERTQIGIFMAGDSSVVKNNRVDSSGGHGIKILGAGDSICYNYITNFALVKCDVGGLQTQQSDVAANYNKGMVMYRNIIGNGIGYTYAVVSNNIAAGIYLDLYSNSITIKENTIFNCKGSSLYLLQDSNIKVCNNNLENSNGFVTHIVQSKNISLDGNSFYQRDKTKWILSCPTANIKKSDSNFFLRPTSQNNILYYAGRLYSFPHLWTDSTGFDINSKGLPIGVSTNAVGILYLNPTLKDSTINISGIFTDTRGNLITNSFTLEPYASKTLFPYQMQYQKVPIAYMTINDK